MVENGSIDGLSMVASKLKGDIALVRLSQNIGAAAGSKMNARKTKDAYYLLFTDNEIVVHP